ncbi:DUF2240 family protein [Halospeciosus flavus]|uniref:DUF2240 family protein n=1 Tax=Halospeciosus flavus TaxID=3032283 RepID=A0ABD5Z1E4_9EURY|nr:DUF2240 family protein [Halospeciosus flavus]
MSLRTAVAAPFKQQGKARIGEHEFVVSLSLERDWLAPDEAKQLVDVAADEGLVTRDDGDLVADFDVESVEIPEGFTPDESVLRERSAFEQVVDALASAGHERQTAVASVNELQADLGLTADAAAVVYARREGVEVDAAARKAREGL